MTTSIILAAAVALMSLLAFLAFGTPGKGNQRTPRATGTPKGSAELRNEFSGKLSDEILSTFSGGVQRHLRGDLRGAVAAYESLHNVRLPDGTSYDLADHSRTIKYNLDLAKTELSWRE